MLEPMDSISFVILCFAPSPIDSIIITAATPIIIPRLVKTERILLTLSDLIEILRVEEKSIILLPCSLTHHL